MKFIDILANRRKEILSLVADSAAEANHFGLENVDNIYCTDCNVAYVSFHNLCSGFVSCSHRIKSGSAACIFDFARAEIPHLAFGMLLHGFLRLIDKRSCGSIRLPTAVSSAGTLFTVNFNYHVSELASGAVTADQKLSVVNDTRTDSGSERNRDKVLFSDSGTGKSFAESGTVCVIFKIYVNIKLTFKQLYGRNIVKIKVVGKFNQSFFSVDRTGCSDTDAFNFVNTDSGIFGRTLYTFNNIRKNFFCRTGNIGLRFCTTDDLILIVNHACNDICSA